MVTEPARPILEPRCVFFPDSNLPFFISFHCHMRFAPFQYFVHFLKRFLQCSVHCPHLGWSYRISYSPIRFLYMFLNVLLLWGFMHYVHRQEYQKRLLNLRMWFVSEIIIRKSKDKDVETLYTLIINQSH